MWSSIFLTLSLVTNAFAARSPRVTVKNGTLRGLHSGEWDQDFFLGEQSGEAEFK